MKMGELRRRPRTQSPTPIPPPPTPLISSTPDFLSGHTIPRRAAPPPPRPWRWTVAVDLNTSTADIPPAVGVAGVVKLPGTPSAPACPDCGEENVCQMFCSQLRLPEVEASPAPAEVEASPAPAEMEVGQAPAEMDRMASPAPPTTNDHNYAMAASNISGIKIFLPPLQLRVNPPSPRQCRRCEPCRYRCSTCHSCRHPHLRRGCSFRNPCNQSKQ